MEFRWNRAWLVAMIMGNTPSWLKRHRQGLHLFNVERYLLRRLSSLAVTLMMWGMLGIYGVYIPRLQPKRPVKSRVHISSHNQNHVMTRQMLIDLCSLIYVINTTLNKMYNVFTKFASPYSHHR